jgi:hypothetical protein
VGHLSVADQLKRDQVNRAIEIVVTGRVLIPLDGHQSEVFHIIHLGQGGSDAVRFAQIKAQPHRVAAHILRGSPSSFRIAAGDDRRVALISIVFG